MLSKRDDSSTSPVNRNFYDDVMCGLRQTEKSLPSKYFYDAQGDVLFQQIMHCPEYYLTRCEEEILREQREDLAPCVSLGDDVTLVELGAGDGSKTFHLLQCLVSNYKHVTYHPIDISSHILKHLEADLGNKLPELSIDSYHGDYFEGLAALQQQGHTPKVVLFLGANIGNMPKAEAMQFCIRMRSFLNKGDKVLIGFDLVKNPRIIQAAYDDEAGLTRRFNINLLTRMNRELDADFNEELFEHYCHYDPTSGTCSSYLVSLLEHTVLFPEDEIHFDKGELIHMEVSQKYLPSEIDHMASETGFAPVKTFTDKRGWFVDVLWEAK
ncbi:L-histidine N(alpha)-methyltransferase [Sphingobacterium deserti]|nr:L-histidine N(alpha)-methyltransferase [Sphingobacterium deserti]